MGRAFALLIGLAVVLCGWAWWRADHAAIGSNVNAEAASVRAHPEAFDPGSALRGRTGALAVIAPGSLRLEGQVIDGDKQPVAGVRVSLGGVRETATEADGSFAFDGLAAGTYALAAERGGAYAEERDAQLTADSDPVTLELRAGATLVVRVIASESGAAIEGAAVETRDRKATTDARGVATLRAIDSGYERLEITAPGRAMVTSAVISEDPAVTIERTIELVAGAPVGGTVIDPEGQPVAEARVHVTAAVGDTRHSVETDALGRWSIPLLPAGTHAVQASSERFTELPEATFQTDGVHPRTDIVVRVDAGATIRGVVVDPSGAPVAEAAITTGGGYAHSDERGRFEVHGMSAGDYEVVATTDRGISEPRPVTLARGGSVEVRLVVTPSSLAGTVVDDAGQPVASATVKAYDARRDRADYATTDDYGKFDFGGLAPGDYSLRATHDGGQQRDDEPALTVRTGRRDVRLRIAPLGGLRGRVVLDGKPVEHFGLTITDDPETRYGDVALVRSADGRFARTNLGPGAWHVILVGPSFGKLIAGPFQVPRGGSLDLGDLVVSPGRTLTGRVTDERGAPVAGATVGVAPTRGDELDDVRLAGALRGRIYTQTDADGRYALHGLDRDDTLHLAAAHPQRGRARPREVAIGDAVIDLVLVGTGAIAGSVARFDGHQRSVTARLDDQPVARASIDHAGGFRFPSLPAGAYTLELDGTNTLRPLHVVVAHRETARAVFELPASPITLAITAGASCRYVTLRDDRSSILLIEDCKGHTGELTGISPGSYEVCADGACVPLVLPAAPARQTVAIPAPPPDEPDLEDP